VEVLDSVIAQQRMAASAHLRPSVSFLPLLLGAKPATHTKFASSSDDEDDEEEYEEDDEEDDEDENDDGDEDGAHTLDDGKGGEDTVKTGRAGWLGELNPAQRRAATRFLAACRTRRANDDDEGDEEDEEMEEAEVGVGAGRGALQLVQGPPGCGKTRFVAALLRALVDDDRDAAAANADADADAAAATDGHMQRQTAGHGRQQQQQKQQRQERGRGRGRCPRVLVCAPSNKAVTVALEQYLAAAAGAGNRSGAVVQVEFS
jgi:hypothetical protein